MKFEIYEGRNKKWFWRLVAENSKIIADGSQGYSTSQNARRAVTRLKAALTKKVPLETKKKAKKKAA
jgi:uncharacterized protein YegP (UPF0339 family)